MPQRPLGIVCGSSHFFFWIKFVRLLMNWIPRGNCDIWWVWKIHSWIFLSGQQPHWMQPSVTARRQSSAYNELADSLWRPGQQHWQLRHYGAAARMEDIPHLEPGKKWTRVMETWRHWHPADGWTDVGHPDDNWGGWVSRQCGGRTIWLEI